jgi:hypothetical protein
MPRIADVLEHESRTVDLEQGDFERLFGRRERKERNRRIRAGALGVIVAIATGLVLARSLTSERTTADRPQPSEGFQEPTVDRLKGEPVLQMLGDPGAVVVYADGLVLWEIGNGDPGYQFMRLTPEGAERLRSMAIATGLFEHEQGLTLQSLGGTMHQLFDGSIEVRRGGRSVTLAWGWNGHSVGSGDVEEISAATPAQGTELTELVAFLRDPTAWGLPRGMYMEARSSIFVPSCMWITRDGGPPDWSKLPSPAREVVRTVVRDGGEVISIDQAREIARSLARVGIDIEGGEDDIGRGLLAFFAPGGGFVHSGPALPHEAACERS